MSRNYVSIFLVTFLIWLGLTASFSPAEIITGVAVSIIVAALFGRYARFSLGIDLPVRVLNPRLPINPAIVKIPTNLEGNFSKLALANSMTLTPGTFTVDMDEENLYVHWIDAKSLDPVEARKLISQRFERMIGGIFE